MSKRYHRFVKAIIKITNCPNEDIALSMFDNQIDIDYGESNCICGRDIKHINIVYYDGHSYDIGCDCITYFHKKDWNEKAKEIKKIQSRYRQGVYDNIGSKIIKFGKHKGKTWKEVYEKYPYYCKWISEQNDCTKEEFIKFKKYIYEMNLVKKMQK